MRSVDFVIQLGAGGVNLKALRDRGWEKRFNVPNRALHYRLSLDKKQAIVQAEFSDVDLPPLVGALSRYTGFRATQAIGGIDGRTTVVLIDRLGP